MVAIKERGETPFDEAGDGLILLFTNSDLKRLQADTDLGNDFLVKFTEKTLGAEINIEMAERVARIGVKDKDRKPHELTGENPFDDMTVSFLVEKILDALYRSVHGKTFQEYMNATAQAYAEAAKAGTLPPPQSPDTISSPISESGV